MFSKRALVVLVVSKRMNVVHFQTRLCIVHLDTNPDLSSSDQPNPPILTTPTYKARAIGIYFIRIRRV